MSAAVLDAARGKALKLQGQQYSLDFAGGEWRDQMLDYARAWLAIEVARGMRTMTIECLRAACPHQPASHYAWGSAPRILKAHGLIVEDWAAPDVQRTIRAESVKTHSHPVKVWRIVGAGAQQ